MTKTKNNNSEAEASLVPRPVPGTEDACIAAFASPSIGESFPAEDAEKPGSGEAGATESPAGNPARVATNDAAFADFLAKGPKLQVAIDQVPAKEIAALWNELVKGTPLPVVVALSEQRKVACKGLWAFFEGDKTEKMAAVRELFEKVTRSSFCANSTFATFDWVIKPANRLKVLEGNYDDRAPTGTPRNGGRR